MDTDIVKHAPGLGGVVVVALLKIREGWRVMLTQATAGLVIVLLLRDGWLVITAPLGVPPDIAGFLLGGLGVKAFEKCVETLQQLEFARPLNSFIERWTGKAAKDQEPKEPTA
jgi:hypothetical protein